MKRFVTLMAIFIITAFITGCPKKPTIVKEEAKAPAVDVKKAEDEEKARKQAEERVRAEARAREEAEERAKREAEARAMEEERKAFRFEDVYFDFDRAEIKERYREVLKDSAEWLSKNKGAKVTIEGHCDEKGNNDYNMALGERRAYSVKRYLIDLGVNAERLDTVSFGAERPVCTESKEDCWWQNRRVHFKLLD